MGKWRSGMTASFDVAIVGGGLAGCAAATLFAREGLSVALVERDPDGGAYKTACTHLVQSSALPALERLGVVGQIDAAGGVRNRVDFWTRWGWISPPTEDGFPAHNYNLRRARLDPLVREAAAGTDGVELMLGQTVVGLAASGDGAHRLELQMRDGATRPVTARVVVGADGRASRVAELAGIRPKIRRNERFAYWGYFRDLPLARRDRSLIWFLDPDMAYVFPNDDGLTLVAAFPTKDKLAEWRADPETAFASFVGTLPDGPNVRDAEREGKLLGQIEMPNVSRSPAEPDRGIALIGDAALASDPAEGVGCGWALRSAEWLVDSVAPALKDRRDAAHALRRYRRRHRTELAMHHLFICDYARGRKLNPGERLVYRAATRDERVATRLYALAMRNIKPHELLTPGVLGRSVRTLLRPSSPSPSAANFVADNSREN